MILPNELRIGNWIRTTTDEQVYDVLCDCINTHEHECLLYDMIAPIPLTGEWLVRFGFEKNTTSWTNWKRPNTTKEVRIGIQNKYLFYNGLEIQYVHQLQNLYFALTCEELELSPK